MSDQIRLSKNELGFYIPKETSHIKMHLMLFVTLNYHFIIVLLVPGKQDRQLQYRVVQGWCKEYVNFKFISKLTNNVLAIIVP